ncbi:MAG TPA: serine hydrolase domain-containing protein [Candidatus Polarisedimenticolaceae bacterium]|nr:serine hydrolase domain-containing protein [Candidatus Polarisedimenticolaceae bacterium]
MSLREFLEGEIRAGAMPAAAWWVGDGTRTIDEGAAGHAVLTPHEEKAGSDTAFDLASLTKPIATALVALLEGLELEATLGACFPELARGPFADRTLRETGTHRARLPAWLPLYAWGSTREAYVAAIASAKAGPAGETVYSDLGYLLLGFALASSSGRPLDRLFDERIAKPLALERTGFPGTGSRFARAAATERGNAYERRLAGDLAAGCEFRSALIRGHVHDGNAWALGGVAGHAGLFGTAKEVGSITRALLDPRPLGVGAELLTPLWAADTAPGARTFGFHRAADTESVRGVLPDDAVGHFGFTGTSLWIDRSRPRIYVLLTNRVHPDVPGVDFTRTRRGFHERAAAL